MIAVISYNIRWKPFCYPWAILLSPFYCSLWYWLYTLRIYYFF